jgi:hypothetical protein
MGKRGPYPVIGAVPQSLVSLFLHEAQRTLD